jgi:uncharacterized protein (TIGR00725 family)
MNRPQVAVIGGGTCTPDEAEAAGEVGRLLAEAGAVLVCGGLAGVMEAACRGAQRANGLTVGILPGPGVESGNPWLAIRIATGMGDGRNWLVVNSAQAVIAIGGGYGTLSEIGLALTAGRQVIGLRTWEGAAADGRPLPIVRVQSAADAVQAALQASRTWDRLSG